jgi:hypothetical protein
VNYCAEYRCVQESVTVNRINYRADQQSQIVPDNISFWIGCEGIVPSGMPDEQ